MTKEEALQRYAALEAQISLLKLEQIKLKSVIMGEKYYSGKKIIEKENNETEYNYNSHLNQNKPIKSDVAISANQVKILEYAKKNKLFTTRDIVKLLEVLDGSAYNAIYGLIRRKKLEKALDTRPIQFRLVE